MDGYSLTPEQRKQGTLEPSAFPALNPRYFLSIMSSGFFQTRIFHSIMGHPVREDWSYQPSVSERLFRGKLLVEEVIETLKAMGLTLVVSGGRDFESGDDVMEHLSVEHVEGSRYDPIETADGLADIKVIVNGTALVFGIPLPAVEKEVWASNISKLDENGKPILNECVSVPCETRIAGMICDNPFHLRDGNQPVGKILKPETYIPANIASLYIEYTEGDK